MILLNLFIFLKQGRYCNKNPDDIYDHGRIGLVYEGVDAEKDPSQQIAENIKW